MSKYNSNLRTTDGLYNESYKFYQEHFNAQNKDARTLGALGDCICVVREAMIYLSDYGELIPSKLEQAMKRRIKLHKECAIKYFNELNGDHNHVKLD